jgi:hypothetical protein
VYRQTLESLSAPSYLLIIHSDGMSMDSRKNRFPVHYSVSSLPLPKQAEL